MSEIFSKFVHIAADHMHIEGTLELPENPQGIVLFAHGSGSSHHSPRNNYVAQVLRLSGIGTLLMDLLSTEEETDYQMRFDIQLLSRRLLAATQWLKTETATQHLPVGYFGASTGAAAALQAAAMPGNKISAVVSRGGRPDMTGADELLRVACPTLLLIGELDDIVIKLNQKAYEHLNCIKQLTIIHGATHLFDEPGTLEEVASLASNWFKRYLVT